MKKRGWGLGGWARFSHFSPGFIQHSDVGKVSIGLIVVETIAYYKLIRNGETAVMNGDGHNSAVWFVQEGADTDAARVSVL